MTPHPLDVLFLTNFSDHCFRVIPSVAQMADHVPVRLTLMHVYDSTCTTARKASETLESFFPEADRYRACRRVVAPGPVVEAVKRHLCVWPTNLLVAPASDPIGLPRFGDRSLRARLIESCGVPLWTMGRHVPIAKLLQPVRNVACWIDFRDGQHPHVPFAMEYAHRLGATLHLLQGLPAIDEGMLSAPGDPDRSLHPDDVAEELTRLCDGGPVQPQVRVGQGEGRRGMARMLKQCDADVVFLRDDEWLLSRWLGLNVGLRLGDGAPCPAVYVSGTPSVPVWNLEPMRRSRADALPHGVAARGRVAVVGSRAAAAMGGLAEIGLTR